MIYEIVITFIIIIIIVVIVVIFYRKRNHKHNRERKSKRPNLNIIKDKKKERFETKAGNDQIFLQQFPGAVIDTYGDFNNSNNSRDENNCNDNIIKECPPLAKVTFTVVAVDSNALLITVTPVVNATAYDIRIQGTTNNTDIKIHDTTVLTQTIPVPLGTYVVTVVATKCNCRSSPSASTPTTVSGPTCTIDNDCLAGNLCSMGSCIPGCNANQPCPLGSVCSGGNCVLGCQGQEDCPDSSYCLLGRCNPGCISDVNCPLGTICDTTTNLCVVGCNGVCPAGEYCNGSVCVPGCIKNENCPTGEVCNTNNNLCVQCVRNSNCPDTKPLCSSLTNTCLACLGDTDCSLGEICTRGLCVAGCTTNLNCPADTPICSSGTCVGCTSNTNCSSNLTAQVCDTTNGECVECNVDTDCPIETFCSSNLCVPGCTTDSNCPLESFCSNGQCTPGCHSNSNCSTPLSMCNLTTGLCVECYANTDCPAGQTCANNLCSCHVFNVSGITLAANNSNNSTTWPNPSDWVFNIPGSTTGQPLISFSWQVFGSNGPAIGNEEAPVSGYFPPYQLTNNTFPASEIAEIWQCQPNDLYGCSSTCSSNSSVNFLITNLIITNSCGDTSLPTCWELTDFCSGTTSFTQITCPIESPNNNESNSGSNNNDENEESSSSSSSSD